MPTSESNAATSSMSELLNVRDRFADHLRRERVAGILSVGLTKQDDNVQLFVATRRGRQPALPKTFETLDVVVEEFDEGMAY